jgi:hypothetical protein
VGSRIQNGAAVFRKPAEELRAGEEAVQSGAVRNCQEKEEMHKPLASKELVHLLTPVVNSLQVYKVPLRGLEPLSSP